MYMRPDAPSALRSWVIFASFRELGRTTKSVKVSPMMVCLLQSWDAARGRPSGGRPRPRALHLPAFPYLSESSERPGAVQGARFVRGGGKSFPVLKRFSGANPGRRGPFWNIRQKGKRAGGPGGAPLAGCGAAPRLPYRALLARHKDYRAPHQAASASTKLGKSSNTHLFFSVR